MMIGELLNSDSKKGVKFGAKSEDGTAMTPKASHSQATPTASSTKIASRTRASTRGLAMRDSVQEQVGSFSGSYEVEEVVEKRRGKRAATGGKGHSGKKGKRLKDNDSLPLVNVSDSKTEHSGNSRSGGGVRGSPSPRTFTGSFVPAHLTRSKSSTLPPRSCISPSTIGKSISDQDAGKGIGDSGRGVKGIHVPTWGVECDDTLDNVKSRRDFVTHSLPLALQARGVDVSLSEVVENLDRLAVDTLFYHEVAVEYLKQVSSGLKVNDLTEKVESLSAELEKHKIDAVANEFSIQEKDEKIAALNQELLALGGKLQISENKVADLECKVGRFEEKMGVVEMKLCSAENRLESAREEQADCVKKVILHYSGHLLKSYEFSAPIAKLVSCAEANAGQKMLEHIYSKEENKGVAVESLLEYNPSAQGEYDEAIAACGNLNFPFTQKIIDAAHLPVDEILKITPDLAPVASLDP